MIAILKFDLDNQEDKLKHIQMLKSEQMAIALWKIQNNLYHEVTQEGELSSDQEYLFAKIIEWLNNTLEQYHIYPENLTQ